MLTLMKPTHGQFPLSKPDQAVLGRHSAVSEQLQLEIETFYLFAKIFLDKAAQFVEHCFGSVRQIPLHSHDNFVRRLDAYAAAVGLIVSPGFRSQLQALKDLIADFRDCNIAHEQSPRMVRGMRYEPGTEPQMILMKAGTAASPVKSQLPAESTPLPELMTAIDIYVDCLIELYKNNRHKLRFLTQRR